MNDRPLTKAKAMKSQTYGNASPCVNSLDLVEIDKLLLGESKQDWQK
jgi:hypothetical protein